MKIHNKSLALLMAVIFMLGAILPVYADELEDHQRQLQEVGKDISQTRSKIDSVKKQERSIMGEIQRLEKNIVANERQLESTVDRIAYLKRILLNWKLKSKMHNRSWMIKPNCYQKD